MGRFAVYTTKFIVLKIFFGFPGGDGKALNGKAKRDLEAGGKPLIRTFVNYITNTIHNNITHNKHYKHLCVC
jgi:hypothetical protein